MSGILHFCRHGIAFLLAFIRYSKKESHYACYINTGYVSEETERETLRHDCRFYIHILIMHGTDGRSLSWNLQIVGTRYAARYALWLS